MDTSNFMQIIFGASDFSEVKKLYDYDNHADQMIRALNDYSYSGIAGKYSFAQLADLYKKQPFCQSKLQDVAVSIKRHLVNKLKERGVRIPESLEEILPEHLRTTSLDNTEKTGVICCGTELHEF